MRKELIILILGIISLQAFPQRSADYGVSLGALSYLGDSVKTLFKPGPAAQFFYRYNFNPRQSVRANIMGGYITPLKAPIGELGVTYEFNFFPYSTFRSRHIDYTPYIAAGAAFSFVLNEVFLDNQAPQSFHPFFSIPFSAGFKINVANQIGLEFEYGFRKTFYDKFDGQYEIMTPGDSPSAVDHSWLHNNDWYSFMGVSVTWKMYNKLAGCPAFAEIEQDKLGKRRKR
jgi:hypothetical protein